MEFPAQKQLNVKELLSSENIETYFTGPHIYTLDCREINEEEFKTLICFISKNKHILFPYGIIALFDKAKTCWFEDVLRPPLFRVVDNEKDMDLTLEYLRFKREKKSRGNSDLVELLINQTWRQVNNPLNHKVLKEIASWTRDKNYMIRENKIYEDLIENINDI